MRRAARALGSSVTFTFTETGAGTPVAYKYSLNGGKLVKVAAPSGTASAQIVIPERQTQSLTAYAVAADGTVSGGTLDEFLATLSPAAADKDLNGDGVPDLLTVGFQDLLVYFPVWRQRRRRSGIARQRGWLSAADDL